MRKILYASERVTQNSTETFYFILILLVFALLASSFVLYRGFQDDTRNKYKLILHCIMIITSVVPPELPMELSVAVTNSLQALSKGFIYCTEPFRIPFAGKVNVLCFDKTGTLTHDKMILRGVVGPQEINALGKFENGDASDMSNELEEVSSAISTVDDTETCADGVLVVMGACQSLLLGATKKIIGDPMEVESFNHTGFVHGGGESTSVDSIFHQGRNISIKVKQRFLFSSSLKRMSVIADVTLKSTGSDGKSLLERETIVCTKGAPEVIENLLARVPSRYRETYLYHMSLGRRTIALASKVLLPQADSCRASIESQLTFVGFLVFDSNLKGDTKSVMKELKLTNNKIVIITGDSAYTAGDVAKRISLVSKEKPLLILDRNENDSSNLNEKEMMSQNLTWKQVSAGESGRGLNEKINASTGEKAQPSAMQFPYGGISSFAELCSTYHLCVTGNALNIICGCSGVESVPVLCQICDYITIFARVVPSQKEHIINAYNMRGHYTLMCGDGTNDVGALRAANVGISIINNPELESKLNTRYKTQAKTVSSMSSQDRAARALVELEMQNADPTVIKLGDASIASPFTARRTSIDSVLTVLRQGRCTQVTTIQVKSYLLLHMSPDCVH